MEWAELPGRMDRWEWEEKQRLTPELSPGAWVDMDHVSKRRDAWRHTVEAGREPKDAGGLRGTVPGSHWRTETVFLLHPSREEAKKSNHTLRAPRHRGTWG